MNYRLLLIATWGLVAILGVIKIVVNGLISTDGISLSEYQNQISEMKRENIVLKEQVVKASSLTTLKGEASKEGFVIDNDILFLTQ